MNDNREVSKKIENLIQTNIDRVAGYEKALEATNDPNLISIFKQNKDQSSQFLSELKPLALQIGIEVQTDTSAASDLYRGWMDIKDSFSPDNPQSVLNWCEKGEDIAKNAYHKATESLSGPLDTTIMQTLTSQQSGIEMMHDQIKSLRDANKND